MRYSCRTGVGVLAAACLVVGCAAAGARTPAPDDGAAVLSLAGEWRFRLDPEDKGVGEGWFTQDLPDRLRLPGSLQEQGFGDDPSVDTRWIGSIKDRTWFNSPEFEKYRQPGNVKIPFWLQPDKHYVGAAWYQRDIDIPAGWTDKRVVLLLERCHWFTDVWVDARHIGSGESLCVPHEFVLPGDLAAGKHTLTIRVDNRIRFNVGHDAHSVSDHTQSNWNGITGRIELRATDLVWIDDVQVFSNVAAKSARVRVTIGNATGRTLAVYAGAQAAISGKSLAPLNDMKFSVTEERKELTLWDMPLGDACRLWDEFSPALYGLRVWLHARPIDNVEGPVWRATAETTFGVRHIATKGTQFVLNGRPIFLRGTLECCIFPKTGYPPTDTAAWKRIMEICRAHGLNALRFHSWCPPEAAFQAADEFGFYLQVELPTWAYNMGADKPRDDFLSRELDRILDVHGNHPSFILLSMGNELRGKDEYLTGLVEQAKRRDPRRLYACSTHHHRSQADQFLVTMRVGRKLVRGLRAPGTDWDFADSIADEKIPVIAHEIGQHCVWPDFDEIGQYTGVLKARNFELFRERLAEQGMLAQARDFLLSSGKLQTLCYKEEIEAMMRTPGFGGFQLLDLHDFPGQGTALVGILNAFWERKGYTSPEEYRRFCGATVPLARFAKRAWTSGEVLNARVDLAHFGESDLAQCAAEWTLTDHRGKTVGKGRLPAVDVPAGGVKTLGAINIDLDRVQAPARVILSVSIPATDAVNDWNLWVYPDTAAEEVGEEVVFASDLDEKAVATLADGGRVVLLPPLDRIKGRPETWQPIFWNTQWFRGGKNYSLGLLCDVKHQALAAFPTEFHSDWQWHGVVNRSVAVDLSGAPTELRPIVQVVPDWNHPRREALLFEARVGKGRLLFCAIDLATDLANRPEARQMRRSLLVYAASEAFAPKHAMTLEQVRALLK